MTNAEFEITGAVELFEGPGGWHFVRVAAEIQEILQPMADRGLIAVTAVIGGSSWKTSLLPMGDGTVFLALPKKIRDAETVELGGQVHARITPRER